ncbi:flagellar hook-length control protein FliK [Bacillus sp. A301a_S52]|nr:flagellar hook-length control protein FliK [Bacillus sp. A301a_S52]
MNGMMAFLPMMMSKQSTQSSFGNTNTLSGKGNSEFLTALSSFMADNQQDPDASLRSLEKQLESDPELAALLNNQSLESLIASLSETVVDLQKLISDLNLEDSFLSKDLLDNDDLSALLSMLPPEWTGELTELIENNTSLESIVADLEVSGDPVQLLALIAAFSLIEKDGVLGQQKVLPLLQQMAETYFPKLTQDSEGQVNRQLLAQLKEFFNSQKDSNGMSQMKSEGQQPMNTNRFAELAYLNQLASSQSNTKPTNQTSGLSMMLDSSNGQLARFYQMSVVPAQSEGQAEKPSQEHFIRQFQNLLSRSTFQQLTNGVQQLNVKLHPASLGRLDITLQQVNGVLQATLMTTTKVARDLIEGQLGQLRHAFQTQNIQVDKIEIQQQQSHQLLKDSPHEDANHQQAHEENDTSNDEDGDNVLDFSELLDETFNAEV